MNLQFIFMYNWTLGKTIFVIHLNKTSKLLYFNFNLEEMLSDINKF